jgi:hypothetical protein
MSTPWYARRVQYLHSVESDPVWYARVAPMLPTNVRYELRDERIVYTDLSDYEDGSLDFAVIDGDYRGACARAVIPKIRAGGYVFLDNSDKDMTVPRGEVRLAEAALRAAVKQRGGRIEQRTGVAVGLLVANQWMLVGFD